jgi:D-glycero-D-manno-heptose 1,7-bisphosphate phosphatase
MRLFFTQPPESGLRPAIFLDRDGVINQQIVGGYVTSWAEFRFLPGVIETLARLAEFDLPVIVISNQAAVEKGLIDRATLAGITRQFVGRLEEAGARIDAVYYCPHRPETGCECRKPKAGLLLEAAREWRLDLSRSVFVGDSMADMEAARAAGCKGILLVGQTISGIVERVGECL